MTAAQTDDRHTAISPEAIDELFATIGQESRRPASTASPPTPTSPRSITTAIAVRSSGHYAVSLSRPRRQVVDDDDSATIGDWCLRLLFGGLIAFGVFCLLMGMPNSPLRKTTVGAAVANYVERPQIRTREIQEFDVGMRAAGKNPLRGQVETAPEPDPETSRKLVLQMKKESGRRLTVKLLRSLQWMELVGVREGGTFFLDLPEMGAVGDAFVEAVLPCPPIQKGPGNVVTGVFAHEADPDTKILSVTFANGAYIKGVTDNHPFYSVDRNDFVEVGQMREGDTVKIENGTTRITKIDSRFARPGEMLYNLETHNDHVYQVTTAGVLVHNNCVTGSIRGKTPNKIASDILERQPTWRKVAADKGHGWKILDDNGVERIRYMYPQKNGKFLHERAGYFVRQNANGDFLDIDGSIIPPGPDLITLRHIFDTSL